ncbi:hypothetical protein FEM03_07135 [Phragmitibacter flavus]|uniref:PilN domain-containing protein n=1 Tax=Phragmitibacter flavus TaxID=2576071 RepID=A0A5R8KG60_9BACT|nr:hypothetical protein [Phragmitibacter flavus]TLD71297.1 hypothetical protein FEM03_07135 [Phragmitibacter flavus]
MSNVPSTILHLPGEDRWEQWRRDRDGLWERQEGEARAKHGIQAVPLRSLVSSPFPALAFDGDDAPLEATVALRWNALGVETPAAGCHWFSWQVAASDQGVLMGTLALADIDFGSPVRAQDGDAFEPSVSFFPLPCNSIILWKELGRFVLAFTQGETLLHVSAISAHELQEDAIREIRDICHILAVNWPLHGWTTLHVWTEISEEFKQALETALAIPVLIEARPTPQSPAKPCGLLPASAATARIQQRKQRQQLRALLALLGVLVFGFAAWAGWLMWQEQQLNRSFTQIHARQPEVERVQQAQVQWWALEPAVNRDNYPLEVFREIVALLPPEGIRFKEFSMDLEKVVISGEATSLIHASKFQSDLKTAASLKRFAFNAPQPTILDDNRANFRVEGIPTQGGADEIQ